MFTIPAAYTLTTVLRANRKTRIILILLTILVFVLGFATPTKVPWYKDYRIMTIYWRSAFHQYYLYSINVSKFHDLTTPLIIYSEDRTALGYTYRLLHNITIPRDLIRVYVVKQLSLNNVDQELNLIYSAGVPLDIAVFTQS